MSEEKKEPTGEEILEQSRKNREEINKRFDVLMEKMEEEGYNKQGYGTEDEVNMPGVLFADFLNIISQTKRVMELTDKSLEQIIRQSEMTQNNIAELTLDLMEQHVQNVEDGNTSSMEELDKADAEKKIKPVKKKKK